MAWYAIDYSCGHSKRQQLYGPMEQRDRQIKYAKECLLCPDCYRTKLENERAAEAEEAAKMAQEVGLPQLVGSPKQIKWAETIRAKQIPKLRMLDDVLAKPKPPQYQEAIRIGREILKRMMARTSAKEWIDSRDEILDMQWLARQVDQRCGVRHDKT